MCSELWDYLSAAVYMPLFPGIVPLRDAYSENQCTYTFHYKLNNNRMKVIQWIQEFYTSTNVLIYYYNVFSNYNFSYLSVEV